MKDDLNLASIKLTGRIVFISGIIIFATPLLAKTTLASTSTIMPLAITLVLYTIALCLNIFLPIRFASNSKDKHSTLKATALPIAQIALATTLIVDLCNCGPISEILPTIEDVFVTASALCAIPKIVAELPMAPEPSTAQIIIPTILALTALYIAFYQITKQRHKITDQSSIIVIATCLVFLISIAAAMISQKSVNSSRPSCYKGSLSPPDPPGLAE
jgi:hypothetical protein